MSVAPFMAVKVDGGTTHSERYTSMNLIIIQHEMGCGVYKEFICRREKTSKRVNVLNFVFFWVNFLFNFVMLDQIEKIIIN